MTRRHKSNYYSNEGMRQLQAQINELWEHLEAVRQAYVKSEDTTNTDVFNDLDSEVQVVRTTPFPDDPPVYDPQPFKVQPTGRGWYQVVDSEGRPVEERKLRQKAANEACEKAMQSVA